MSMEKKRKEERKGKKAKRCRELKRRLKPVQAGRYDGSSQIRQE
jgi:hypothetical protein